MSMSKNTVKYILMLLGLAIFVAGYFLVYMDYTAKTDDVNKEILTLSAREDVLKGYSTKIETYKSDMVKDKTDISGTLNKFYSMERPEDFIMLATDVEKDVQLTISGMSFTEPLTIYTISGVTDGKSDNDPVQPMSLSTCIISCTLNATMSYDQMKKTLDYIASQQDVTKLNSLNMTFDSSTGKIGGSFVIDKYYITGRDIPEHQAVIPYTDLGKSVLIGS